MIKTIVFSDPHGDLPLIREEFDLMLIGGDICPAHDHYNWYQREWLSTVFCEWVMSLPFANKDSKVVFIGGNHDCYLCEEPNPNRGDYSSIYTDIIRPCGGRLVYLEDDEYIFEKETEDGKIESLKIYGCSCRQNGPDCSAASVAEGDFPSATPRAPRFPHGRRRPLQP